MAKTYRYAVFEVRLKRGVTGDQLEKLWREELRPLLTTENWWDLLLKRSGGSRGEEYLLVGVIDNEISIPQMWEKWLQWQEDNAELVTKWRALQELIGDGEDVWIADYMEVK